MHRARAVLAVVLALMLPVPVAPAAAAVGVAGTTPADPDAGLLDGLATDYRRAVVTHDAALAARLRTESRLLATADPSAARDRLARVLRGTSDPLHPWPLAETVRRLAARAGARPGRPSAPARPYGALRAAVGASIAAERAGEHRRAVEEGLRAYALSARVRERLGAGAAALDTAFWSTALRRPGLLTALDRHGGAASVARAADRARDEVVVAQQTLGDVRVSRATVVADAAIIVFREGLEAVLILAAITASFVGSRRPLRRPVLLGGLAGIVATGLTWVAAQLLISELGTGGLRLEAITGLLAIGVLLVVTNWFFHRVYWSEWIARFNRRRKALERLDRLGFGSGQALGLAILGLTSVYREGFETVLFIQNLQVSAGASACLIGSGIGLTAVLGVGALTFVAQRKLPYKRMLVATGIMIALVLAVMTGTTVHVCQGLGWLPTTSTGFTLPVWTNSWLGLYPTWEGLGAQVAALAVVVGSYALAREVQIRRPQRRARRRATGPSTETPELRAG